MSGSNRRMPYVSVTLDLAVSGYLRPNGSKEFSGTLDRVAAHVDRVCRAHWRGVEAGYERHGDHREFCPELGGGYPARDPSMGEVVSFGLRDLKATEGDARKVHGPGSPLYGFLKEVADGRFTDASAAARAFVATPETTTPDEAPSPGRR